MDKELEDMKKEIEFLSQKNELQQQIDKLKNSMNSSQKVDDARQNPQKPNIKSAPKTMLFLGLGIAAFGAIVWFVFGNIIAGMGLDMLGAVLI